MASGTSLFCWMDPSTPRIVSRSIAAQREARLIGLDASPPSADEPPSPRPLLQKAGQGMLLSCAPQSDQRHTDPELTAAHLLRHDVKADVEVWSETAELSIVEALFACFATQDADLIVAGANHNPRLVDGLFGGPTKEPMREPTLALLMSH